MLYGIEEAPPLLICCHHPEKGAGPLMTSLRQMLAEGRFISDLKDDRCQYLHLRSHDALSQASAWLQRHPNGILLFNGAFSLQTPNAWRLLRLNRVRFKARQIVFWHDGPTVLREVAGWSGSSLVTRVRQRWRFGLVRRELSNARTWHLAVSRPIKQLVMYLLDVTPNRVVVCGNAIDVARCPVRDRSAPHAALRVCMAGDPSHRKGLDRFLRVAALLNDALGGMVRCTWYGGDEAWLRGLIQRSNGAMTQSYLHFPGNVSPLVDRLANEDVFLLTSRDDPFPIVGLEALACDLPVFCFDTTGIADVVDPDFICRTAEEMADKVKAYRSTQSNYPAGHFRSQAERYGRYGYFPASWRHLLHAMS